MIVGEKESLLQRTILQLELAQEKLQVGGGSGGLLHQMCCLRPWMCMVQASMDRCRTLEAEAAAGRHPHTDAGSGASQGALAEAQVGLGILFYLLPE